MPFIKALVAMAVYAVVSEVVKYFLKLRKERRLKEQQVKDPIEADGHYVQIDCAQCSKLNRIAASNVKRRPICGGCKSRLLPKRRISILRVRNLPFDKGLDAQLDAATIKDYDKFWSTLANHFGQTGTAKNEPIDVKDLPN